MCVCVCVCVRESEPQYRVHLIDEYGRCVSGYSSFMILFLSLPMFGCVASEKEGKAIGLIKTKSLFEQSLKCHRPVAQMQFTINYQHIQINTHTHTHITVQQNTSQRIFGIKNSARLHQHIRSHIPYQLDMYEQHMRGAVTVTFRCLSGHGFSIYACSHTLNFEYAITVFIFRQSIDLDIKYCNRRSTPLRINKSARDRRFSSLVYASGINLYI